MRERYWSIFALALGLIPAQLTAGNIYNNLGPGNSYAGVGSAFATNNSILATTFTTTGGGTLSTVLLPMYALTTPSGPITMALYTNSGGQPGTLLESWQTTVTTVPLQLITLTSALNPALSSGTQYWFVVSQPSQNGNLQWTQNNQGVAGGAWLGNSLNTLSQFLAAGSAPAIQLNSTAPPTTSIPPSMMLTLGGLACLGLYMAGRKFLRPGGHAV